VSPTLVTSPWVPGAFILAGAAIGATASIVGGAFSQWFTWQKERQSLAAALASEVQGFMSIVGSKQIRSRIQECIDRTNETGKAFCYKFPIDDHPFPVFEQNVSKIGFLPIDLAEKVAEFYTYARGTVQDFRGTLVQDWSKWPAAEAVRFMEGFIQGIDAIAESAKIVVPELKREVARTWMDYLQPT
jgi:hypothetical protein